VRHEANLPRAAAPRNMKESGKMSIDLAPFCNPKCCEPGRDLSVPFSLNGHTYATNGHICVRVPRRPDIPENKEAPNAEEKLPWSMCAPGKSRKFAPLPEQFVVERAGSHRMVAIGRAFFGAHYVKLMRALPGLEVGKPKPEAPLPFRFEGGEGLLMPLMTARGGSRASTEKETKMDELMKRKVRHARRLAAEALAILRALEEVLNNFNEEQIEDVPDGFKEKVRVGADGALMRVADLRRAVAWRPDGDGRQLGDIEDDLKELDDADGGQRLQEYKEQLREYEERRRLGLET
jgi:hypothetical protein